MSDLFAERATSAPVLAILRGFGLDGSLRLCDRLWDAGVELVEIPVQDRQALDALQAVAGAAAARGLVVGAGTVVSAELVREAADAGAAFTVAPGMDSEVAEESARLGLPHLPGVGTAGDVHRALRAGLTWQKAFPAHLLGEGWYAAMHGPFPQARFCATGGVTVENAVAVLDSGAEIVALGNILSDEAQVARIPDLMSRLADRRS